MEFHFCLSFIITIIILSSCSFSSQFHIPGRTTHYQSPICKPRPADIGTNSKNTAQYTVLDLFHWKGACALPRRDDDENQQVNTSTKLASEVRRLDKLRLKSLCSTNKPTRLNLSFQYEAGGAYMVRLGLGTPKTQYVHLIMDTGSHVTWTQCQPCTRHCYTQRDPIFNPLKSASYSNISCKDPRCPLSEDYDFGCYRNTTCMYGVTYGDESYTVGLLGTDTLDLSLTGGTRSRAVFQNFIFGCGQNNNVTTEGEEDAGILGLSRHPLSLVSQIAAAPNSSRQFSYCIPTDMHSMGYLTIGKKNTDVDVRFTPFTTCPIGLEPLYCVEIMSINIGNTKLPIKQSVFKNHTLVDSGTTFTYLPQLAYNALSKEFNRQMDKKKYPLVPPGYDDTLDTCYNTSKHKNITHPLVSFTFKGNVTVNIDPHGTLFPVVESGAVVCLAFAADLDVSIFGNLAQMTHEVVYDISGNQLGFSSSSCV